MSLIEGSASSVISDDAIKSQERAKQRATPLREPALKIVHYGSNFKAAVTGLSHGVKPSKIIWSAERAAVARCSGVRTVQASSGQPNTLRAIQGGGAGNCCTE